MGKTVLFLVNHDVVIYNFRLEIVERLIADGHDVHISSPYGERIDDLVALGAKFHDISMERHGMNPFREFKLIGEYKKLFREIGPDICLGFTIKPNIYGAIAARKLGIPFVANITGLGTAVENPGLSQKILIMLYKYAFRGIRRVFFQNEENRRFFADRNIAVRAHAMLPGSGVNLSRYPYKPYPCGDRIRFAFISRIMREKGTDQYLEAAEIIKRTHPEAEFHVCGFAEDEYSGRLGELHAKGIVNYHGMIRDVAGFMAEMNCIVHPTYYPEGISNVLLEACATGRPIITTDRSGCREVVEDGVNGFVVEAKNTQSLVSVLEKFIALPDEEKERLGRNGRAKVEREFDRNIVVEKYVREVENA
ncbi:MAG: glycosyltransferase family 4 protein [Clostridia bacterium]|nr:glycosyltransferase family 4 protein [Clostridia bacterium]